MSEKQNFKKREPQGQEDYTNYADEDDYLSGSRQATQTNKNWEGKPY